MKWSVWRWMRLLVLSLVVVWLGQKFLLENNSTIPGLSGLTFLEKFNKPNSETYDADEVVESSSQSASNNFVLDGDLKSEGAVGVKPTWSITPTPTFQPTVTPIPNAAETTKEVTYIKADPATFPYISDSDVVETLNAYRASHKVHQLVVQQNLCEYAEKRVADLVANGGLDHHEGFKKDFEGEKIPQALQSYPGTTIGENLAYQYCINMQTGDSFIANSSAALIEWCFDSSTAGHREAQLNPKFNNVCVRHKDGLFVVMFGD